MKRVITYGTFDLLHYGHINLLRRAKALGDYLIVVVSSDEFNWKEKHKKTYFTYEQRKQLLEAIRYVESLGLPEIAVYEQQLLDYAMERMRQVPAMRIFGEAIRKSSVLSFALGEIHHSDTGILLDKMGIAVRTGQLCAEPVMQHYGVTGMVRASIGMYNTSEEIDLFCEGLHRVAKMFKLA